MKFVGDPEAANWLAQFGGRPDDFEWDAGNRMKNRKHEVTQSDVEALFQHPLVFVGRIMEPVHNEDRWLALRQNATGRRLSLVFTRRGSRLRPISCRSMRRGERTIYEEALYEDEETGSERRAIALKVEDQLEVSRAGRDMTDSKGRTFEPRGV